MSNLVVYSEEQTDLLKRTVAAGATNDEFSLFINQCKRTGLDPFTRQIYFTKDKKGKVSIISSIDGLRLVAERSDKYEGQTKAEWCGDDGVWKDIWLDKQPPKAARVGVYKNKFREPLYGVALFDEYCGRYQDGNPTFMWAKMPALMIAKVAEALALRKAFPNDLSGIYSQDEMQQAEKEPTDGPKLAEPTGHHQRERQNDNGVIEGKSSVEKPASEQPRNEQRPSTAPAGETKADTPRNESPISMTDYALMYAKAQEKKGLTKRDVDERLLQMGINDPMKTKVWQFQAIMKALEGK